MLKVLSLAGVVVAAVALVGCSGPSLDEVEAATGVTEVSLEDNKYQPRVIEIPVGTEVTWIWNDDSTKHDVAGDGFESTIEREEFSFTHTFMEPGTYDYRCSLHTAMTGRVIVVEEVE